MAGSTNATFAINCIAIGQPDMVDDPRFRTNLNRVRLSAGQVKAALASDVDVFAAAVGVPAEVIARARAAGKQTMALVGAPKHARKALEAGVDMLIAQGHDAGPDTGAIGTFSLIPQVVDMAGGDQG